MRSEAGQINAFNKLINYKPENEEQNGKENYKLTLGFIKSLISQTLSFPMMKKEQT